MKIAGLLLFYCQLKCIAAQFYRSLGDNLPTVLEEVEAEHVDLDKDSCLYYIKVEDSNLEEQVIEEGNEEQRVPKNTEIQELDLEDEEDPLPKRRRLMVDSSDEDNVQGIEEEDQIQPEEDQAQQRKRIRRPQTSSDEEDENTGATQARKKRVANKKGNLQTLPTFESHERETVKDTAGYDHIKFSRFVAFLVIFLIIFCCTDLGLDGCSWPLPSSAHLHARPMLRI